MVAAVRTCPPGGSHSGCTTRRGGAAGKGQAGRQSSGDGLDGRARRARSAFMQRNMTLTAWALSLCNCTALLHAESCGPPLGISRLSYRQAHTLDQAISRLLCQGSTNQSPPVTYWGPLESSVDANASRCGCISYSSRPVTSSTSTAADAARPAPGPCSLPLAPAPP